MGQGTLYRHFPTREDLLAEVYREEVQELVATAPPCWPTMRRSTRWPAGSTGSPTTHASSAACSRRSRGVWQDLSAHSHGPIGEP